MISFEGLWIKSKLMFNLALDETEVRSFDEKGFWAATGLEILAKASLAYTSPLLVVKDLGENNVLQAAGLVASTDFPETLPANAIYKRCGVAFRPFDEREAGLIARARNGYIHSEQASLLAIPPEVWWPRLWAQVAILVNAVDRNLDELVGDDRIAQVEEYLSENRVRIANDLAMYISRAKQRLTLRASGTLPAVRELAIAEIQTSASLSYRIRQKCPACEEEGMLEGEDELETSFEVNDEGDPWVALLIGASHFGCHHCGLVLSSLALLSEAGLPDEFRLVGDISDYYQPEYDNE